MRGLSVEEVWTQTTDVNICVELTEVLQGHPGEIRYIFTNGFVFGCEKVIPQCFCRVTVLCCHCRKVRTVSYRLTKTLHHQPLTDTVPDHEGSQSATEMTFEEIRH